jgi:hypothetical protein
MKTRTPVHVVSKDLLELRDDIVNCPRGPRAAIRVVILQRRRILLLNAWARTNETHVAPWHDWLSVERDQSLSASSRTEVVSAHGFPVRRTSTSKCHPYRLYRRSEMPLGVCTVNSIDLGVTGDGICMLHRTEQFVIAEEDTAAFPGTNHPFISNDCIAWSSAPDSFSSSRPCLSGKLRNNSNDKNHMHIREHPL